MTQTEIFNWAINIYVSILSFALPVAIAFGMSNLIVNTVLSVAFGGKLKIGGKS